MRGDEVADDFGAELARNLGLDLPLARATKEQYDRMIAEDLGDLDKSGIAELRSKTATNIPAIACDSFGTVDSGSKERAFCFKALQFEFAERTCRNQSS